MNAVVLSFNQNMRATLQSIISGSADKTTHD